jgi:hypothetical protein
MKWAVRAQCKDIFPIWIALIHLLQHTGAEDQVADLGELKNLRGGRPFEDLGIYQPISCGP